MIDYRIIASEKQKKVITPVTLELELGGVFFTFYLWLFEEDFAIMLGQGLNAFYLYIRNLYCAGRMEKFPLVQWLPLTDTLIQKGLLFFNNNKNSMSIYYS
jgi:hypothetical protein